MEQQGSWADEQREGPSAAAVATEVGSGTVTETLETGAGVSSPSGLTAGPTRLEDLRGTALVEGLIARDSKRLLEQTPDAKYALRGIRRHYERQAAVADGVYVFLKKRGLAKG